MYREQLMVRFNLL